MRPTPLSVETARYRLTATPNGRVRYSVTIEDRLGDAGRQLHEANLARPAERAEIVKQVPDESREEVERALVELGIYVAEFQSGVLAPEAETKTKQDDPLEEKDDPALVAEMNERHAVVLLGDRSAVLIEDPDGEEPIRLLSSAGLKDWMQARTVLRGDRRVQVSRIWLTSAERREYPRGIVFAPGQDVPGAYNLWKGFAVEPDEDAGTCGRFMAHLYDNVCQGNDTLFLWVIGWLAQMVQHPTTKLGTALALIGAQGTGKTIIGAVMRALLAGHYQLVSDTQRLAGRFNSYLASTLLLHLDEATWGGDRQAEGKLKDLITGDTHLIEYKGREPVKVQNYTRVLVTGEHRWLVPAAMAERRFTVLEVGEKHKQDHAYFRAIWDELRGGKRPNGGLQALLAGLLSTPIEDVPLQEIYKTDALLTQKLRSLTPEEQWWFDVLQAGVLPGDTVGAGCCPSEVLYSHYVEHAQRTGARHRSGETMLGIFLREATEGIGVWPLRRVRRVLTPGGPRVYAYEFPSLAACREAMERKLGQPVAWPAGDDTWERWVAS